MSILTFSIFISYVFALAFDAPVASHIGKTLELDPQGWSPRPTSPPSPAELRKRLSENLIVGPNAICGYESGFSSGIVDLCKSDYRCGFGTFSGTWGNLYCCDSKTSCQIRPWTSCIDNVSRLSSCALDNNCANNPQILKCATNYCVLGEFEAVSVQAVYCGSSSGTGTVSISTTYAGQAGRAFTPVDFTSSSTIPPTTSTTPTPTPTLTPTLTPTPVTTTPAPPPTSSPSPVPIGAIVGGVVGGIAAIALVAIAIFLCLRSRKHKELSPTQTIPTTAPPTAPPISPYTVNSYPTVQQHQGVGFQPMQPEKSPLVTETTQGPSAYQFTPMHSTSPQPSQQQQQQYTGPTYGGPPYQQLQQQQQNYTPSPIPNPISPLSARHGSNASELSAPYSPAPTYTSMHQTIPEMSGVSQGVQTPSKA